MGGSDKKEGNIRVTERRHEKEIKETSRKYEVGGILVCRPPAASLEWQCPSLTWLAGGSPAGLARSPVGLAQVGTRWWRGNRPTGWLGSSDILLHLQVNHPNPQA